MSPQVSVICPVYNRSAAVLTTIRSVRAQLVESWELIVVLDGCTDDSARWVRGEADVDPRIRVFETPGFGHPSEPRNIGLAVARGRVIAYLDHDDLWEPEHLSVVLELVDGGAALVATAHHRQDDSGNRLAETDELGLFWHHQLQLLSPIFEPSRVAHRHGLVEQVGGWRSGYGLEDWDLWVRLADAGYAFTTTAARTVTITEYPQSRRFQTLRRHNFPLSTFAEARSAAAALRLLRSPELADRIRAACVADTRRWYQELRASGGGVMPVGWNPTEAEFDAAIVAGVERTASSWADDLILTSQGKEVVLAASLWCATEELAARLTALMGGVQAEQLAVIADVAEGHGGIPAPRQSAPAVAPATSPEAPAPARPEGIDSIETPDGALTFQ